MLEVLEWISSREPRSLACVKHSVASATSQAASAASPTDEGGSEEDDDRTFDPRAPRSNYSLYPIEYLLYCEDCHQIRCPRCIAEEVVTYFCPHCLFEVPSASVRAEKNR